MSEPNILVEGLANVNGVDRGSIYELPEPQARMLIKAGFARLYREEAPEPTEEPKPKTDRKTTAKSEIPDDIRAKAKTSPQAKKSTRGGSKAKAEEPEVVEEPVAEEPVEETETSDD